MITTKINNFKIKGNPNAQFENMDQYLKLARRQIIYFGGKYYPGYVNRLLSDDDAISYIAYANMLADWRYNESLGWTRNTYRCTYALGFIKTLVKKNCKVPNNISLDEILNKKDSDSEDQKLIDIFWKEKNNKHEQWSEEDVQSCIRTLNPKQQKILKLHVYDNLNFAEIGRQLGVSRERVRQVVSDSFRKMRKELENVKQE